MLGPSDTDGTLPRERETWELHGTTCLYYSSLFEGKVTFLSGFNVGQRVVCVIKDMTKEFVGKEKDIGPVLYSFKGTSHCIFSSHVQHYSMVNILSRYI